jgi:predicted GH43/DUF377 family glycosyl hydrolase
LRRAALALTFCAAGCTRYGNFGLPSPEGFREEARWTAPRLSAAPVLPYGAAGEWDSIDTLNPSVAVHDGVYFNFYSGFDGRSWHTGLATSKDGLAWKRVGKILSPAGSGWEGGYIAANGHALIRGGDFYYWYQAGDPPRIGLARSADGRRWRKHGAPVLAGGPRGSWDERAAGDPHVIEGGEWLYMFYLGEDRARRQRLGMARSRDGIDWEKQRSSPVLELGGDGEFDENGLGEPAVWKAGGRWWMLYTGRDRKERRAMGMAYSDDGVRWERMKDGLVLRGAAAWNSQVACDATVVFESGKLRVWYGGGDAAHPAERIHGQIGYFEMTMEKAP